ncbi:exo-alpha-sialidase [Sphingomonas sp. R-74633]|nr:exo-alpha-sialidase [Sphingomonas sp. R-74633]
MRSLLRGVLPRLLCILAFVTAGWAMPALAQRTMLAQGMYPRAVQLSHNATPANNGRIVVSFTTFTGGSGIQPIYASDDNGTSFTQIGTITDPLFSRGLCCGTLYELPQAVGALSAGTLLWAGSVGGDTPANPMQIRIYKSTDRGATWSYLSNCATGTVNRSAGGLWEPEFTIAANGALVCFYSDETVTGFSQMLQQVTSTDGLTWTAPVRTVASGVAADRPGMAVVRKLPSGRYFMTFELCGPAGCTVFYKTSPDGINWTPAGSVGARVESEDGHWFLHTPTVAWAPVPGLANGRIFLIGQIESGASGIGSGNGNVVFYNDTADGSGKWKTMAAPAPIAGLTGTSNVCQNYSPPLLPLAGGTTLFGMTTDYDSSNVCRVYFGKVPTYASSPTLTLGADAIGVSLNQSASGNVTVTPSGGYLGTLKLTVSIPNFNGTASFDHDTLTFTGAAAQTAKLTLRSGTSTASASGGSSGFGGLPAMAFIGSVPLLLLASVLRKAVGMAALAAILALSGCGAASRGDSAGSIVTPPIPTKYTATITATDTTNAAIKATVTTQVTLYN